MGMVTLAVPAKGQRLKSWHKKVRKFLLESVDVRAFVFHSRHVKVWFDRTQRIPFSRQMRTYDKTEHFDDLLLEMSHLISARAEKRGYDHKTAAAIVTHYLFNQSGSVYSDEMAFHKDRMKRLVADKVRSITAKSDHGWELAELKKAGLL